MIIIFTISICHFKEVESAVHRESCGRKGKEGIKQGVWVGDDFSYLIVDLQHHQCREFAELW